MLKLVFLSRVLWIFNYCEFCYQYWTTGAIDCVDKLHSEMTHAVLSVILRHHSLSIIQQLILLTQVLVDMAVAILLNGFNILQHCM